MSDDVLAEEPVEPVLDDIAVREISDEVERIFRDHPELTRYSGLLPSLLRVLGSVRASDARAVRRRERVALVFNGDGVEAGELTKHDLREFVSVMIKWVRDSARRQSKDRERFFVIWYAHRVFKRARIDLTTYLQEHVDRRHWPELKKVLASGIKAANSQSVRTRGAALAKDFWQALPSYASDGQRERWAPLLGVFIGAAAMSSLRGTAGATVGTILQEKVASMAASVGIAVAIILSMCLPGDPPPPHSPLRLPPPLPDRLVPEQASAATGRPVLSGSVDLVESPPSTRAFPECSEEQLIYETVTLDAVDCGQVRWPPAAGRAGLVDDGECAASAYLDNQEFILRGRIPYAIEPGVFVLLARHSGASMSVERLEFYPDPSEGRNIGSTAFRNECIAVSSFRIRDDPDQHEFCLATGLCFHCGRGARRKVCERGRRLTP